MCLVPLVLSVDMSVCIKYKATCKLYIYKLLSSEGEINTTKILALDVCIFKHYLCCNEPIIVR